MCTITIGLDLAKHVFQVHGVDTTGQVIIRKKLRRSEVLAFFKELPPSGRHGSLRDCSLLGTEINGARP